MKRIFKKAISILLTAGMLVGTITPYSVSAAEVDISKNLIAHYDFEDAEGTAVPNVCGDTFTGTLSGSNVALAEEADWGKVLSFSASANDGCMTIPGVINTGANSYTISMWYKLDNTVNRGNKRMVLLQQTGSGRTLLTLTSGNQYHTYVNATDVTSDQAVNVNNWQHVAYVYDSDAQKVSFYVNGKLDSTKAAGSSEVNALTDLLIGRHKNGGNDPLPMAGFVDEVRVYEGVASADVVNAIYEMHAPKDVEGPVDPSGLVLNINPEEVERVIDESAIGINHRYGFNGYGSFDSETMTMRKEFVDLYKEAGFGSIRYPGGTISNLFQWKNTIGPVEERVDQIHGFYNNSGQNGLAANFGLTEIAEFAHEVNSEIVYVYGFGRGSAQDAADLVEYLNAPVGSNPNGGVAWAEVRKANGQVNPYDVRYFEIGNENNQGGTDGNSSQQYWMANVSGGAENAYINGGTAVFNRQYAVLKDNWNQAVSGSDGSKNQVRYMRYANPNPMTGADGKELDDSFEAVVKGSVHIYVNNAEWSVVDSLENQSAAAQVVTVDYRDGSFRFGDGVHGAIPAKGASITVSYNVERDGFVDVARAMKDTTKQINKYYEEQNQDTKVECNTYSSFETQGFITKMASGGYNDLYDGLTIHPYSGTPTESTPEVFYDSAMKLAETAGIAKVQNYVNMLPEGKVPVISEYGIFRSTNPQVRSQTHALYIARVLMEYVRLGSPYIQKHCLIDWYSSGADSLGPTQQAVIQAVPQEGASTLTGEGNFRYFATPSARVFEMMKGYGTQIVASNFSKMETMTNGAALYSALVSKDAEDTIYVAIVNLDRVNAKEVTLAIEGVDANGADITIQTLAGDAIDSQNTLEDPDHVDIEISKMIGEDNTIKVTLPAHSFNVIKVESFDKAKLQSKISAAEAYKEAEYTADSYQDLKEAISAAKAVYSKENATQTEIANAIVGLETAANALVKRVTKADLETIAAQYKDMDLDGYTKASREAFEKAYKDAEAVLAKANAGQDEISAAAYALENAAEALTVDKTKLEDAIAKAEEKQEADYTISSWTAVKAALAKAKGVFADKDASVKEVKEAADALSAALKALKTPQPEIPVSAMTVSAGDAQSGQGADKAIDGNADTLWHTDWYVGPNHDNHWFQIELEEVYTIATLRYQPRQSGPNGIITKYEIWTSMDGEEWTTAAEGSWAQDAYWKEAELANVPAKYIRLVPLEAGSDQAIKFASAAEIRLTGVAGILPDEKPENPFIDIKEADYYYEPAIWAYYEGVTTGVTENTFGPADGCTRGQIVTFLWRIAGAPEANGVCPFGDVPKNSYYYDAILWAVENGITTGTSALTFEPEKTCTRAEIVTFLYREADEPEVTTTKHPFTDVDQKHYYYNAMLWAVENRITTGVTETTFVPSAKVSRGETVTFLYRAYQE